MRRLRGWIRRRVTGSQLVLLLLALAAGLVTGALLAMRRDPGVAILAGLVVFALVLALLLLERLVASAHDFARESLRHDRIAQALPELYREVEPLLPLPPITRWALDPRTLVLVMRIMRARRPEVVVEFGSGVSTLLLGQVAREIGARLCSFEHDAEWHRRVRAWTAQRGLEDTATTCLAPLRYDTGDGRTWYDRRVVADALPAAGIGLVLVDGPPRSAGHHARAGALPAVFERCAEEVTLVMDDCERPEERGIVDEWCAAYPQLRMEIVSFAHDVAILTSLPAGRPWIRDD